MRTAIGGTRLKRWLGAVLTVCLFLSLMPSVVRAAGLTLEVSSVVSPGGTMTIAGTSPAGDVILSVKSGDGELLFFDTQKVTEGSYRTTLTVPSAWADGAYRVTAVSASTEVFKEVSVQRSGSSDSGSDSDSSDSGTSTPPSTPPGSSEPVVSGAPGNVTVVVRAENVDGKMTAVVRPEQLAQALEQLKSGANGGAKRVLELKVDAGGEPSGAFVLELPREVAAMLRDDPVDSLVVATELGSIAFDRKSLTALTGASAGEVRFGIETVAGASLPSGAQAAVGSRPVVDLTVEVGGAVVTDFGGGTVVVGVPYAKGASEDTNAIVAYYIPNDGAPTVVRNGYYDAAERKLWFVVKHFSMYGIGYNPVAFADVSGWSKEYITYLASRAVVDGVGEGRFGPAEPITRAQMIALLAKMSEANATGHPGGLFADVQAGDWHAPYIRWGHANGIVNGTGNGQFHPDRPITREEMAVMISRYAKFAEYELPDVRAAGTFTDRASISAWAVEAVAELRKAGVIDGIGGNVFDPSGTARREEAAKIIAVLLQAISR